MATDKEIASGVESTAPQIATDAVLKPSQGVDEGSREVRGINFDDFKNGKISVDSLIAGMADMGFQASSLAEAVRIINDMVILFRKLMRSLDTI
jgi:deoxyhypusine synthase